MWFIIQQEGNVSVPMGGYCWRCGTTRESFLETGVDDSSFNTKYTADTTFRAMFKRLASQLSKEAESKAHTHCQTCTEVTTRTLTGVRLKWVLAFVSEDNFSWHFGCPPKSIPGIQIVQLPDMNGRLLNGVLIKYDAPTWPPQLPLVLAEAYSAKETVFIDYVHNRTDLHSNHGSNLYHALLRSGQSQRPAGLQEPKDAGKLLTFPEVQEKVTQLASERAEATKRLEQERELGPAAPTPMVSSGSRLQAVAVEAAQAKAKSGAGKQVGRKRIGIEVTPKKQLQSGVPKSSASPRGCVESPVTSHSASSTTASSARKPEATVIALNPKPKSLAVSGQSGVPVAYSLAASGHSCMTTASDSGCPRLRGPRGERGITVAEVLAGYSPGRELKGATIRKKHVHPLLRERSHSHHPTLRGS